MPKIEKNQAEAGVEESQPQGTEVTFTFRERDFTVPRATFTSARLLLAVASGEVHRMVYESLGGDPALTQRLLSAVAAGESLDSVAVEFFDAISAAGQGNS